MCMVSVNTETMDLSAKHRSTYETLSTMGSALDYPKKHRLHFNKSSAPVQRFGVHFLHPIRGKCCPVQHQHGV